MIKNLSTLLLSFCFLVKAIGQTVFPYPVPEEFATAYYEVVVNGQKVPVFHAGLNVYFASFDFTGNANVEVIAKHDKSGYSGQTANKAFIKISEKGYWGEKPLVRPSSKSIHVALKGASLSFELHEPGQYSVEREGTSSYSDDALFLFANAPDTKEKDLSGQNIIHLPRGIHQKNIELKSGQTLYLDAGAVLHGSVNVWDANNVRIVGKGTIVYYGPQSETRDDGWKHLKNWHPLTTHNARNLLVNGVTFIGRSRTWSIQMYNTFDALFDNVKVIAVNPQNINGDGFDWYGGGRTKVVNSFVRSMDDCFAFFTPASSKDMWAADKTTEGEVNDVIIQNCVLWTSLANIYRVGFYGQNLRTNNIAMKDCDVLHISRGEWFAPNSIICAVSPSNKGKGRHSDYVFERVRFEEPCAVFGLQNEEAQFRNISFKNTSMQGEQIPSLIHCLIEDVTFESLTLNGKKISKQSDFLIRNSQKNIRNLKFISD